MVYPIDRGRNWVRVAKGNVMTASARPSKPSPESTTVIGARITLFNLLGFRVQVDFTWLFLALLIAWSLARSFFPSEYPGLSIATYWWMGVAGMVGLLFSLVFHELSHSIVARRYGLQIRGITLFIFGGVAEMASEPPSAKAEFWMALAGPAASLLISMFFYAMHQLGTEFSWPEPVDAVAAYLSLINLMLAGFNLVPAYPLDGGRVLRAALWWWRGNIHWATRYAALAGSFFGMFLMAMGLFQIVFAANFVAGMWWFLIGLFLRGAAKGSYAHLVMEETLAGVPVGRFMAIEPIAVSPETTFEEFVESYIYRYHHEQFPVVRDGELRGMVGAREVKSIPRAEWPMHTVAEVVVPSTNSNTIDEQTDAALALTLMSRTGNSRLLITRRGRLVGILTLKDLLNFISLKADLEDVR